MLGTTNAECGNPSELEVTGVRLNLDSGMLIGMATGEINAKLPEGLMVFSDGVETATFVEVDAERVFALIDKDLRKTPEGFLRGSLSYNVVSFEQVRAWR